MGRSLKLSLLGIAMACSDGRAQSTSPSIGSLDDLLAILTSPEPQYQGVSHLINNSDWYFQHIQTLSYGDYEWLDAWAEKKLKDPAIRALVERGEAYRYVYYNKELEAPKQDPVVKSLSKEYQSILAYLRGNPRAGRTPPLYTHSDAQRETRERLSTQFSPLDQLETPDIYKHELNSRTFRLMEQPDYTKKKPDEFQARLQDVKNRLARLQVETFKKFMLAKLQATSVHIAPLTDIDTDTDTANPWYVKRDQTTRITLGEFAKGQIEIQNSPWGNPVFVFKKQVKGKEVRYAFGVSEHKGHWSPLSNISPTDTLIDKEEFLGKLETKFLKGESNQRDLHLALLKKQIQLAHELRTNLDRVTKPTDLPKVAQEGIAKLSDFNQRPQASQFHWIYSHGLSEYRGETTHYNRLIDGIIWEGRGRSVDLGADYWQQRDEEAARRGRGFVQAELKSIPPPSLAGGIKQFSLNSISWISHALPRLKRFAFPENLSMIFGESILRNTSEKDIDKKMKKLLFDIERDNNRTTQFRTPGKLALDSVAGTLVPSHSSADSTGTITLKSRIQATPNEGRIYLVTPRNHRATSAKIYDIKGKEIPHENWNLKHDAASGHHWIDFVDPQTAPKWVHSAVQYQQENDQALTPGERSELLISDLNKFAALANEVEGYGFQKLAQSLKDIHDQAVQKDTALSIEEVRQAFVNTALYSYKDSGERGLETLKTGEDHSLDSFMRFQKEGAFCGQCDSANEFFAAFMNRYFDHKANIRFTTDVVFETSASAGLIRLSDMHLVTQVNINNKVAFIADATPTELGRVLISNQSPAAREFVRSEET